MIKIVTDSTAYCTSQYAKKHDIKIIPLTINTKKALYTEGMPGEFDEIFEEMLSLEEIPKSSQPAPKCFEDAFNKILNDGNEVICITLSASLSGTYNAALLAAKACGEDKITVIDSAACAQLSLLYVEEAVNMAENGMSRAEIESKINLMKESGNEIFAPVTLKHLIIGGRIGGVAAVIGSLLHVKPLLSFKGGMLTCKKKIIGMIKAIKGIAAEIPKTAKRIYVMHIYKSDFFPKLLDIVKQNFPDKDIKIGEVGPVIGTHVGPGTVGIAYV